MPIGTIINDTTTGINWEINKTTKNCVYLKTKDIPASSIFKPNQDREKKTCLIAVGSGNKSHTSLRYRTWGTLLDEKYKGIITDEILKELEEIVEPIEDTFIEDIGGELVFS